MRPTLRRPLLTAVAVLATSGVAVAKDTPNPASELIAGAWHLNDDLSPDAHRQQGAQDGTNGTGDAGDTGRHGGYGRRGGGGGGGRGGGFGGGGFGGGHGGGMGRGGGGGGYGGGRGGIAEGAEDRNRMRALTREMRQAPKTLALVVKDGKLNTTEDDGTVITLPLNDKKTKVELDGEQIEARAKWDGANIVTEWSAARVKLTRTYASSADGKVLTVRVAPEEKKGGPPPRPPMTLVYDRE